MTNDVIKSGVFVEGVEVTSDHIGKYLEVVRTNTPRYLPLGFHAKIYIREHEDEILGLLDTECKQDDLYYCGLSDDELWEFRWVDRSIVTPKKPVKQASEQARSKLAKQLREAWNAKCEAEKAYLKLLEKSEAPEYGLSVKEQEDGEEAILVISYNAPTKFYN
jgi:hypothetical protein